VISTFDQLCAVLFLFFLFANFCAAFPGVGQHHNFHYKAFGVLVALTFTGPKYF